jgi:D-xylono/L-arabinono-1,4-lactonase
MPTNQPEMIADYQCQTGESPLWHPDERRLYWLDIPRGRMFRYEPATGRHEQVYEGDQIGGFTLQADGALLLFMARGRVAVWRHGSLTTIIPEIERERESRFNDVEADPAGRVLCGTMSIREPDRTIRQYGQLYRLDPDGSLTTLIEQTVTSNGMGFSPDQRTLYHADSGAQTIVAFDYDRRSGRLSNRRLIVETGPGEGRPDGLTVDAEGCLWSARWDGGCVVRLTPDGRELERLSLPARKVSSVAFGGPDYDELYITTAGGDERATEGPGAGALFRAWPGVRGAPVFRSRIGS